MSNVNSETQLVVKNLTKKFGDLLVLDDISFEVKKNEFLCIVGPTGCGKTTFLNSLSKLYDITSGDILIDGKSVDLQKNNIAYIFQEYSNFPWLTIQENVEFGLKVKHMPAAERREKAEHFINMVGLSKFKDYYPRQVSASMLQRAAIARAFAVEPELLLMDEPYGQLDIELRFRLEDELINMWEKVGTTVIFITHNIEEAVYLSERILVLTNKPTKIKQEIINDLPRPRDIADPKFIDLRNQVTDLIKWW